MYFYKVTIFDKKFIIEFLVKVIIKKSNMQLTIIKKSDVLGVLASGLCLIHCIATPFIFVAQTCSASCCSVAPTWWSTIDYVFLGISFFAIYWSVQNTSKNWIKYALWINWVVLLFVILNEKIGVIHIDELAVYVPALCLVGLHLYNQKYCQCNDRKSRFNKNNI